jgi:predicted dinucleotide-binding enzyme
VEDGQTKGPAPSLFTYDDHTGVQNTIVVPADDEDAAQKIADLYEANDFEALAKYEKGE